jgi:hypothetical protein
MSLIETTNSQNWLEKINGTDTYVKDMLSFFQNGWDARGNDDQDKIKERLRANVINSLTYTHEIISELGKLDIKPTRAYIKGISVVSQSVLISISIDDYLSDKFTRIYNVASKIEKESKSENYSISFNFTFDDGNLDGEALSCDGFIAIHP